MGVKLAEPPKGKGGYYLLAYDLFNYSAACNPCNSALKRDYFPISEKYRLDGTSPESLRNEQPLLIYPIGDFDTSPEDLIKFNGLFPYASGNSNFDRERGLVTIEFFKLDSIKRSNLLLERAKIIEILWIALEDIGDPKTSASRRDKAERIIRNATSARAPHANCARSFCDLFSRDPSEAKQISTRASEFADSKS
jgi:hypothetical protein